jgi:hypothetical protein
MLVMALAIAGLAQLQAKWIDYTPDITSDSYWDSHRIGAVRITAALKDELGRDYVIVQLERQISGEPMEPARTILLSQSGVHPIATNSPPFV